MLKVEIIDGRIKELKASGNAATIISDITMIICNIMGSMDKQPKEAMYNLLLSVLTDKSSPAYKEIFPEEESDGFGDFIEKRFMRSE